MKIQLSLVGRQRAAVLVEAPLGRGSKINTLIWIHIAFFALYAIPWMFGWLHLPVGDGTIADFIDRFVALPEPGMAAWPGGIITHQFVHFNPVELLLSIFALWFFGHLLSELVGEQKVIILYFATVLVSALVFVLSHYVFRVFSGHGAIMDGAFAGVLGVMTTTVILFRSHSIRVLGKTFVPLWQIYAAVIVVALALLFKPSIAYIFVYICSISFGIHYALRMLERVGDAR